MAVLLDQKVVAEFERLSPRMVDVITQSSSVPMGMALIAHVAAMTLATAVPKANREERIAEFVTAIKGFLAQHDGDDPNDLIVEVIDTTH
jgi:hypothetical protein